MSLLFFKFSAITLTPLLLKPSLLIKDLSSTSLKILFFGFPGWGKGVTVPISINPKPKFENSV